MKETYKKKGFLANTKVMLLTNVSDFRLNLMILSIRYPSPLIMQHPVKAHTLSHTHCNHTCCSFQCWNSSTETCSICWCLGWAAVDPTFCSLLITHQFIVVYVNLNVCVCVCACIVFHLTVQKTPPSQPPAPLLPASLSRPPISCCSPVWPSCGSWLVVERQE